MIQAHQAHDEDPAPQRPMVRIEGCAQQQVIIIHARIPLLDELDDIAIHNRRVVVKLAFEEAAKLTASVDINRVAVLN